MVSSVTPTQSMRPNPSLSPGLHGKLTGAGGGGFAFALIPSSLAESRVEKVREALQTEGFTVLRTKVGGKGVEVALDEA